MTGDPLDFIACEESYKSGGGWRSRGSDNNGDNKNGCFMFVILILVIISIVIIFCL